MATLNRQDALHHRCQPRHRPGHRAAGPRATAPTSPSPPRRPSRTPSWKAPSTPPPRRSRRPAARRCRLPATSASRSRCRRRSRKTVETFGGLDICVNNASRHLAHAVSAATDMKRYDLMHGINARGTFLVSKTCIPHLKKAANPHILMLSPPLDMNPKWFAPHVAYSMAKFNMSIIALGLSGELKADGIAVNTLWPRTTIATAAVQEPAGRRRADAHEPVARRSWATRRISSSRRTPRPSPAASRIDDTLLHEHGVQGLRQVPRRPHLGPGARLFVPDSIPPPPGVVAQPRASGKMLMQRHRDHRHPHPPAPSCRCGASAQHARRHVHARTVPADRPGDRRAAAWRGRCASRSSRWRRSWCRS